MMRKYRDTYLKEKAYGNEIIQLYYEDAPGIIEAIEREPEKEKIYEGIYQKIQEVVKLIENQKYEEALIQYGIMVYKLKRI